MLCSLESRGGPPAREGWKVQKHRYSNRGKEHIIYSTNVYIIIIAILMMCVRMYVSITFRNVVVTSHRNVAVTSRRNVASMIRIRT